MNVIMSKIIILDYWIKKGNDSVFLHWFSSDDNYYDNRTDFMAHKKNEANQCTAIDNKNWQ